jgi:molecular chaperone GrpE
MQEPPPPGVAENAGVGRPEALSPDAIEAALAEFRTWLLENPTPGPDAEAVTLDRVLEQFTALRQEVNLQTRASRAQLEQNGQTLERLEEALHELRNREEAEEEQERQTEDEHLRPLLKAIVEVHDNLLRAHRETQKVRDNVAPVLDRLAEPADAVAETPPDLPRPAKRSWWFGRSDADEVAVLRAELESERRRFAEATRERIRQAYATAERIGRVLEGVVTGHRMSLERVEAVLRGYGLEAVLSEGQPYDPERMEVLEAVPNSGRANNEVVEEVRRGYLWRGRVFRYALVRVAKG